MVRSPAFVLYAQGLAPINQGYDRFSDDRRGYTHSDEFSNLAKKHDIKLAKGYKKLFPSLHGTSVENNKNNLKKCFKEELAKSKPSFFANAPLWDSVEKELEYGLNSPKPLSKRKFKSLKTHSSKISEKFQILNNHKQSTISSLETILNTHLNCAKNNESTKIVKNLSKNTLDELIHTIAHNVFFEHSEKIGKDNSLNTDAQLRLDSYLTKSTVASRINSNIINLSKIMKNPHSISVEIFNSIKELDLSLIIQKTINKNESLNKLTTRLDLLENQYPQDTYEIKNLLTKLDCPTESIQQEDLLETINLISEKIGNLNMSKRKKKHDLYNPLINLAYSLNLSQDSKKHDTNKGEISSFSYKRIPLPFLENLFSFLEKSEHKAITKAVDINHWNRRLENSDIPEAAGYCQELGLYDQNSLIKSVKKFGID